MNDADCTAFLQWALPRIALRWPGFRKVRKQVCKRLARRMHELHLTDVAAYRARLAADPAEWRILDGYCRITISRFFRDRGIFEALRRRVLPAIAARARQDARPARIWSAGCASGEEAYTLRILWDREIAPACPDASLAIVATDSDETMLARAREGCFAASSLRELPPDLIGAAFDRRERLFCVKPCFQRGIEFLQQDLREQIPEGRFDLILCRYVAFTYFAGPLQERVLRRMTAALLPGGYLAIGTHERLADDGTALTPLAGARQIFRQAAPA